MSVILKMGALCFLGLGAIAYGQYEGRVGVNTDTPSATLNIKSKTGIDATTKNLELQNANGQKLVTVLDNGNVGIGKDAPINAIDIKGETYEKASIAIERIRSSINAAPAIEFRKTRGAITGLEPVENNDAIGALLFRGYNGTDYTTGAYIRGVANGTPTSTALPTDIEFATMNDGDINQSLRMIIKKDGKVGIEGVKEPKVSLGVGNPWMGLNYIENDGLFLFQGGTSNSKIGIKSIGEVEISSDSNANFSSNNGRFEGIKFKTSEQDRMIITEKGKVKIDDLVGTGDRVVFADENGVLKTGTFTTKASKPSDTETCSATNEGTMYYKTITKNSKQVGVFGFCTRDTNGDFVWFYRVGENSIMSGTDTFGTGL